MNDRKTLTVITTQSGVLNEVFTSIEDMDVVVIEMDSVALDTLDHPNIIELQNGKTVAIGMTPNYDLGEMPEEADEAISIYFYEAEEDDEAAESDAIKACTACNDDGEIEFPATGGGFATVTCDHKD